jgi:flotillin
MRLEVEEVLPAEVARDAKELIARGEASPLLENARATARVADMLARVWREAGEDAARVFLIQQLEMVLREAARIPAQVELGDIRLVDSGDGASLTGLVNAYPDMVRHFLAQVREVLGIDVVGALTGPEGAAAKGGQP